MPCPAKGEAKTGHMAQCVEFLSHIREALGSSPQTTEELGVVIPALRREKVGLDIQGFPWLGSS